MQRSSASRDTSRQLGGGLIGDGTSSNSISHGASNAERSLNPVVLFHLSFPSTPRLDHGLSWVSVLGPRPTVGCNRAGAEC